MSSYARNQIRKKIQRLVLKNNMGTEGLEPSRLSLGNGF